MAHIFDRLMESCECRLDFVSIACGRLYGIIQLMKLGPSDVKSSRWQLDEEASQRRAHVFWQLFVQDTWLVCVDIVA